MSRWYLSISLGAESVSVHANTPVGACSCLISDTRIVHFTNAPPGARHSDTPSYVWVPLLGTLVRTLPFLSSRLCSCRLHGGRDEVVPGIPVCLQVQNRSAPFGGAQSVYTAVQVARWRGNHDCRINACFCVRDGMRMRTRTSD